MPCFGSGWNTGNALLWQLSNIVSVYMYQTPYPKGEGESGTVSYTEIYSPWNFRSMNLIGWVLLNCIVAFHRWLSTEKCSDVILGREHLDMRLPLIHIVANKYPLHKFCLPDMLHTHFRFRQSLIPLTAGVWLMFIAITQAEKQSVESCKTLAMFTGLHAYSM